jgi:Leucine-rich repeat (LRR) protein
MTDRNNSSKYYRAERQGCQKLPEEIFEYPDVEVLSLRENQLHVLDERIGRLTKLYSLDLSYNQISTLPDSFAQLKALEYLFLGNNQFSVFPTILFQLPRLRQVSFFNNQLEIIPEGIKQWKAIQVLDLGNNNLTTLPDSLAELQALECLNLILNQFSSCPAALCRLPQLRVLRLKSNQIATLPAAIGQLKNLQHLDLAFNPLQGLPAELAQLQQLKELIATSNQFFTFPEVLLELPQLTDLANLDLNFRLGLSTKKLNTLFGVLKKLPQKTATPSIKKAIFALLFNKNTTTLKLADVLPLLGIKNKVLEKKVQQYLTHNSPPPTEDSRLFMLGTRSIIKEAVNTLVPWTTTIQEASHIVLGQKIKKTALQQLPTGVVFLSEIQVQQHYQTAPSMEWLQEHREQLLDLLYSQQGPAVLLALQWLEGSPAVADWATELLIAYILLPFGERQALQAIQNTLLLGLPNFELSQLPHVNFKLYTAEKSELEIKKRIAQCTASASYWDGIKVAQYLFKEHGAGYLYLINQLAPEALAAWLQQFVQKNTLCLSTLQQLKRLPTLHGVWSNIQRLDLRGCAFMSVPLPDLLKQMPNLEEIDLRDNPIRHLPRTRLAQLARYRILISK